MQWELRAVDAEAGGRSVNAAVSGGGRVHVGPLVVDVQEEALRAGASPGASGTGATYRWSITNESRAAVRVRDVALVFAVTGARGPLRMFRHGYQSWSPSGMATLGVDADPSERADFDFVQGVYHADGRTVAPGELRSEWFTVLGDGGSEASGDAVFGAFDGGHAHDGTFRLRARDDGAELRAQALLGDAALPPGETRVLHALDVTPLDAPSGAVVADALARWADAVGRGARARVDAVAPVGWCSWYHYFGAVTERDLTDNLERAADWPFTLFQLDDGFQSAIGDWLTTNEKFPGGLTSVADAIRDRGLTAGVWLAPFLVAPDSSVATLHPDWLVRHTNGEPRLVWWNPDWGGGYEGFMYGVDTTRPDVLDHLATVAYELVETGFDYLKLDFTFAPSVDGVYHDPSRTPAQRVRAGYDAIRRGAGDDAFLLGCGVPLANVVGVVDANRIGQDVAPRWALDPGSEVVPGYGAVEPATVHALGSTLARAFMHRRLWVNDPDCVMLRTRATQLTTVQAHTWADVVGRSGGMVVVSDDLAFLGPDDRAVLERVLDEHRVCDAAARGRGPDAPRCPDLLVGPTPARLAAAGREIEVDLSTGASATRDVSSLG